MATALAGSLGMAVIGGSANAVNSATDGSTELIAAAAERADASNTVSRADGNRSITNSVPQSSMVLEQKVLEQKAAEQKAAEQKKNADKKAAEQKAAADKKAAEQKKNAKVAPVAGLDQKQMDNAAVIVRVGKDMKLSKRAQEIAIATAMQESNLYNLASDVLPESTKYPHQGSGRDHDSVGLFQQRPSSGWGSVKDIMQPEYAAKAFYSALRNVNGYENMPLTVAAQTVQVSAFPDHYAKHESRAKQIVDALSK